MAEFQPLKPKILLVARNTPAAATFLDLLDDDTHEGNNIQFVVACALSDYGCY